MISSTTKSEKLLKIQDVWGKKYFLQVLQTYTCGCPFNFLSQPFFFIFMLSGLQFGHNISKVIVRFI